MKDFISKPANFSKIEFWAVTTIFVFAVFFHLSDHLTGPWNIRNEADNIGGFHYHFVAKLLRYAILYLSFLLLNFKIVPALVKKEALWLNILSTVAIFFIVGLLFGIIDTFLKYRMLPLESTDRSDHNLIIQSRFLYAARLLLLFGFYSVVKYIGLYLLSNAETIHSRYKVITPGGLVAFVISMIFIFFLITGGADKWAVATCAVISISAILLYGFSLHNFLPKAMAKRKPFRTYIGKVLLVLVISFLPVWLLGFLFTQHDEAGGVIASFNVAFQLFLTAPFSWIIYKRTIEGDAEIHSLKKELGQSAASFDFLRSQINPHFLFNALNTIYGTALQEKAERTSEGIEKLGDMMRFMLQENMQEKISLSREIDYLNNYISLQRLRTDNNPVITIDTNIEEQVYPVQIAPMLLIPFVENAFKHGISFREPSHIKITLEIKDNTLYFDVFNNKHLKQESDPEKNKSGIGLNNVKQRLKLLYPGKHELIIRETGKDFFVHLTIGLNK
ncbi:MAG TPA: histidine kinase [Flavisolibacter sp.]